MFNYPEKEKKNKEEKKDQVPLRSFLNNYTEELSREKISHIITGNYKKFIKGMLTDTFNIIRLKKLTFTLVYNNT